jgi:hypothetical protein
MADLIERLRAFEGSDELGNGDFSLLSEAAATLEALRAEVAEWKRVAAAQAELHGEAEARADKLAEALQLAEEHIGALTPEWYSAGRRVLAAIRAVLEQEEGK